MTIIFSVNVPELEHPARLSDYCVGLFPQISSRKGIKKAIDRGEVLLNGTVGKSGDWVQSEDIIQLTETNIKPAKGVQIDIPVVYEDSFFAILNKPSGLEVSGNKHWTLQNALPHLITKSDEVDALTIPRPVHRLDYATSGLIIVAKTASAAQKFGSMLERHDIIKQYRAIVIGELKGCGFVELPLDGKIAKSEYQTVAHTPSLKNGSLTLVDLFPHTGRTHQLRKHMLAIGYPILGDFLYGKEGYILKGKGLFLCAVALKFVHPFTKEIHEIKIAPPNKFKLLLQRELQMYNRANGN